MDLTEQLRPRFLEAVAGQTTVKEIIRQNLMQRTFPKISLFTGDTGTGKSTLMEIVALSLACESPTEDGNPCCYCHTCQQNLLALQNNRSTDSIKKINMGLVYSRKDVAEIIKEIFVLQSRPNGYSVYIFEEMHGIKNKEDQIPFLEEFMHVPEGVIIMMATTQEYKLIDELKGRAAKFKLTRPTFEECSILIDDVCERIKIKKPSERTKRSLVTKCKNTPREIVKIIDLLCKGEEINETIISNYLGEISNDIFLDFFNLCLSKDKTISDFVNWVDNPPIDLTDFARELKNFMINSAICLWGDNALAFDRKTKKDIKDTFVGFGETEFLALMEFVNKMTYSDETKIKCELFLLKQHLNNRNSNIAKVESKRVATRQAIQSERKAEQIVKAEENKSIGAVHDDITEEDLMLILGTNEEYSDTTNFFGGEDDE